jgi:hypothetical protein
VNDTPQVASRLARSKGPRKNLAQSSILAGRLVVPALLAFPFALAWLVTSSAGSSRAVPGASKGVARTEGDYRVTALSFARCGARSM